MGSSPWPTNREPSCAHRSDDSGADWAEVALGDPTEARNTNLETAGVWPRKRIESLPSPPQMIENWALDSYYFGCTKKNSSYLRRRAP
jgi:hypothetical protein